MPVHRTPLEVKPGMTNIKGGTDSTKQKSRNSLSACQPQHLLLGVLSKEYTFNEKQDVLLWPILILCAEYLQII
jgi:hypothetical protein